MIDGLGFGVVEIDDEVFLNCRYKQYTYIIPLTNGREVEKNDDGSYSYLLSVEVMENMALDFWQKNLA